MTAKLLRNLGLAALAALAPGSAFAQEGVGQEVIGQPVPGQVGLHPSVTPIMDSIRSFHDGVLMITISLIVALVLMLLVIVLVRFNSRANPVPSRTTHNTLIEVVWTVVPIIVLVVIAIPSFSVLTDQLTMPDGERRYLGENVFSFGEVEVPAPALVVKVTGQTWNWDYEYVEYRGEAPGVSLNSAMLDEEQRLSTKPDQPRLLAVNNEMVVPVNTTVRLQVTADPTGVIHGFGIPSFGVMIDAIPGRLNETWFHARKTGIYYGQCRELCGKDHAFMPIAVRVVEPEQFDLWLETAQQGFIDDANATLPPL